jgi:hypothetical protein
MNVPVVYLAACRACGASSPEVNGAPTEHAMDVPPPFPYYCPKCQAGVIPAEELITEGAVVGLVDHAHEARWCILTVAGDTATVRPLGLPDWPARTVHVTEIRPKFSYERLAAGRRK